MAGARVLRRDVRGRRGVRGVGFLFFVLFGLLPIFLAGVLSIDLSRAYLARRQVRLAAEAAATAGAQQYIFNSVNLRPTTAENVARTTLTRARNAGMTYLSTPVGDPTVTVRNLGTAAAPIWRVTVTVRYRVGNMAFTRALSTLTNTAAGRSGRYDGSVTRSAVVCTGQANLTSTGLRYCPRPGRATAVG